MVAHIVTISFFPPARDAGHNWGGGRVLVILESVLGKTGARDYFDI